MFFSERDLEKYLKWNYISVKSDVFIVKYSLSHFPECQSGSLTLFPDNRNYSETDLYIPLILRGENMPKSTHFVCFGDKLIG